MSLNFNKRFEELNPNIFNYFDKTDLFEKSIKNNPEEINYPTKKRIRAENLESDFAQKASLTKRLYGKYTRYSLTPSAKATALKYVKDLRPSIATLKANYKKQGLSQEEADLIVTPRSYPNLPNVKITKRQQRFLIKAINGNIDTSFIQRGFR